MWFSEERFAKLLIPDNIDASLNEKWKDKRSKFRKFRHFAKFPDFSFASLKIKFPSVSGIN